MAVRLEKVQGKSKKTGKPFTAYRVCIGEYETPLFFPSKVELLYIEKQMKKVSDEEFVDFLDDDVKELYDNPD